MGGPVPPGTCLALLLCALLAASLSPAAEQATILSSNSTPPTVGMEGRIEVLLPPDLEPVAADNKSPLLLRVASTRPHGSLVHYDFRYIGRVPGEHNLAGYLVDARGVPVTNLPSIRVAVVGLLPATHNGWLEEQARQAPSLFGGYRAIIATVIVAWALLLFPLFFPGRKQPVAEVPAPAAEPTLADRLRPLVEQAAAGSLSTDGKAALERMLINHWRQRLQLGTTTGERLIRQLRDHPEAGRLLRALEDWLHRPPGAVAVNVEELLAPYRNLPRESTEVPA